MYNAKDLSTGESLKFKSVTALVKRLAGKTGNYQSEYDPTFASPARTLTVTRTDKHGTHVVTRVRIPRDSL